MNANTRLVGRSSVPLIHDGQHRPYLLQVPPGAQEAADHVPLLVQLHGRGIDAETFDRMTGFGALANKAGFVLVLPSALGEMWNDGRSKSLEWLREPDDVGYLAAVIDDAKTRMAIDHKRIYVVGMSNGAVMAGRLACELAERIAGVAQVAGTAGRSIADDYHPVRPVPILNIHGTADRYAPIEGGIRRSLLGRVVLRRASEPMMGVDEWAQFWVSANGALDGPLVRSLPPDTTIRAWHGPTPSSDVVFYRVDGAGHTWPGSGSPLPAFLFGRTSRTFDATTVSWEFLAAHTL